MDHVKGRTKKYPKRKQGKNPQKEEGKRIG